jgi:hypothetical protein
MSRSRRCAVRALNRKAAALAIRLFDSLEQPRSIETLWQRMGGVARGPYCLRFNNDIVANCTSAAFNVGIAMLMGEGFAFASRGAAGWKLVRIGQNVFEAAVLAALADGPLTVPALQARLGRWTRGEKGIFGEFGEAMFGSITGVSPRFAHVLCGLAAAGLIHAYWGPRALRIARTKPHPSI